MNTNYYEKNCYQIIEEQEDGLRRVLLLNNVRTMQEHRAITREEIAEAAAISIDYVARALTGRLAIQKPALFDDVLERIEDAITRICDERGMMCACSHSAFDSLRAMLSVSHATGEHDLGARAA